MMKITGENLTSDLREQVELLVETPVGTVALDRDFGIDFSFLDQSISTAINQAAAEIAVKIEKYIPALHLKQVKGAVSEEQNGKMELEVIVGYDK